MEQPKEVNVTTKEGAIECLTFVIDNGVFSNLAGHQIKAAYFALSNLRNMELVVPATEAPKKKGKAEPSPSE